MSLEGLCEIRSDQHAFRIFRRYGLDHKRHHDPVSEAMDGRLSIPGGIAVTGAKSGCQASRFFVAASWNQGGRTGKTIDPDERIRRLGQPLNGVVVVGVSSDNDLCRIGESEVPADLQDFDIPDPVAGMPVE